MITFLIIMTIICIAAAILDHASGMDRKPKMKNKKKSSRRSVWDDDPFFGTPLQKID